VKTINALTFFARPRYLRAIPSLVLLTTAMAWGMAPDIMDGDGDSAQKKARVTLSQSAASPSGPVVPGTGAKSIDTA
jgi:hypothetical protein